MKTVKTTSSSTSNLFQHLEIHHPKEYSSVAPKCGTRPGRKRKSEDSSAQKNLLNMMPYDKKSDRYLKLTTLVTNYITTGMVPLYTVEKIPFIKMLQGFDPRYQCPSRKYFADVAIPERYLKEKSDVIAELKSVRYLSCTSDGWSSLNRDPYMSLTIHFISDEWNLSTKCLATSYLPEAHTADNIASFWNDTFEEYGIIKEDIITMTTDAAANMVATCNKSGLRRISCFGHILHNSITNTLDANQAITSLSASIRKIVSVFSYSFQYKRRLAKLQKDLSLPTNKLANDVSTRWGSKLKMFKSVLEQLPGIDQLFVNGKC